MNKIQQTKKKISKIVSAGHYRIRYYYANSVLRSYLKARTLFDHTMNLQKNKTELIISITTYPQREKQFLTTLETVMWQTYKPDRIIVWLAQEQYPDTERVNQVFGSFIKRGVEFRFCDDLRSHKKYYYTALENPEAIIITLDDDVYYPRDTIQRLINKYDRTRPMIVSNIAKYIEIENGAIQPYTQWKPVEHFDVEGEQLICPIGVGGVLYSPYSLDSRVFNKDDIYSLCKHTDDLWLNAMGRLNHSKIACVGDFPTLITVKGSQFRSLGAENATRNNNELALILDKYPDSFGGYKMEAGTKNM